MPLPGITLARDAALLALAALAVALAANAVSPRGLSLRRDYFLTASNVAVPGAALPERGSHGQALQPPQAASAATTPATTTKRGLPLANYDAAAAWFRDPQFTAGRIVFVDARSEERYAAGHIAGAYSFDHYRPERGTASVMAAAVAAERVVVYCNGGDCEDSELAALDLIALGVPAARVVVYGGGFSEWQRRGMPVQRQTP